MINKMALALLLGASSTCALAQGGPTQPANEGYSQDSRGGVMRSEFGLCWRAGSWTPNDAMMGCDGPLKPPIANPIAPEVINTLDKEDAATAIARCDFSTTLESDQTFAFGQASLNEQARQRIHADVLGKLADCKIIENITITGHTDPIGSIAANQRLSERRAIAVADLLHGQVSAPINTIGAGNTQPIATCANSLNKANRIKCFAPDRRVEITVTGSKK